MKAPSRRSDLCASFSASPWTLLRSSLVSKAQTSTLAFTAEVAGAAGTVVAGLVMVAGLDPGVGFAGALVSVELQPFVTKKSPKRKIPKMIADVLDRICPPSGSHLEFLISLSRIGSWTQTHNLARACQAICTDAISAAALGSV